MVNLVYSPTKRARIYYLKKAGKTNDEIRKKFGPHRSTINKIVKDFEENHHFYPLKGPVGPKLKMSVRDDRIAVRAIASGTAKTAVDVQQTLFPHVHPQTVRRHLKNKGLHAYKRWKVPLLQTRHRRVRFSWAKTHRKWGMKQWWRVVFSDESKFNLIGSDGVEYCWRRPGEALDPRNMVKRVKHGGGHVMVWGCILRQGFGQLHRVVGNMNAEQYTEILSESLLGTLADQGINPQSILFAQDNDPKHTSKRAKSWFDQNGIKCLPWPAQSPDMNIIEHAWNALDRSIRKRDPLPRNLDELWEALQEEWKALGMAYMQSLYISMPRRVDTLYRARGSDTRY